VLLIVGFPIAVILAWAFEITPEGVKKESEVDRDNSITRQTGRKLDLIIIGVLIAALTYFIWESRFATDTGDEPDTVAEDSAQSTEKSIAILPFADMSAAGDQEYFGDGIAEELLNVLAKVDGLSVASRTSAFGFKGTDASIPEIAAQLKVDHILEGSVRRAGNTIRVTAQLIDVASDRHLWSETYDRQLDDIFRIQDEIAAAIASALKVALGADISATSHRGIESVEAYDLYLSGIYHWNKRTPAGLRRAVEIFEQVTMMAPDYARGHAGLAATLDVLPDYTSADYQHSHDKARTAVARALELDPNLVEAVASQASLLTDFRERRGEAEDWYLRAIELDPKYPTAHHWYGLSLAAFGRNEEGIEELKIAHRLDPASIPIESSLSGLYVVQKDFASALFHSQQLMARVPEHLSALYGVFQINLYLREYEESLPALRLFIAQLGEDPNIADRFIAGIADETKRPEAVAAVEQLAETLTRPDMADFLAFLFAFSGDIERAIDTLEIVQRRTTTIYEPVFDPYLDNPRFIALRENW
jgi:TolB-like protein